MAELSPFNPEYSPQEEVRQDPVGLADRWRGFLADPASRAALMSFGAQLSQPVAPGNNWAGHIGQATGAAGEAATKAFSLEQGDIERESKQVLRESQANAATSRAETAQANSETAATRAASYGERVASQNALSDQRAQTEENRRKFLDAQAELLFAKAAKLPGTAEAERMTAEARMMQAEAAKSRAASQQQLTGARVEDIPRAAEDRATRNTFRQQDADTRAGTRQDRAVLGTQAEERRTQQGEGNLQAKREQTYTEYGKSILPGQPKLPYAEWLKQFGSGRTAPAPQGAPPASPQQPGVQNISADRVLQEYPDAQQAADGNFYVVRNGRKFRVSE